MQVKTPHSYVPDVKVFIVSFGNTPFGRDTWSIDYLNEKRDYCYDYGKTYDFSFENTVQDFFARFDEKKMHFVISSRPECVDGILTSISCIAPDGITVIVEFSEYSHDIIESKLIDLIGGQLYESKSC